MNIARFEITTASPAHEGTILASPVLPEGMPAPFGHAWGYLAGNGEMDAHAHPTREVYFFFEGQGIVMVDGERAPVGPGDVVDIPENASHTVVNESGRPLKWAALWWKPI